MSGQLPWEVRWTRKTKVDQYEGASDDWETIEEDKGNRVPVDTHTIPPTRFNSHLNTAEMRSLQIHDIVGTWIAQLPQRVQATECANEKEAVAPPIHHVAERPHRKHQYRGLGRESLNQCEVSLSIEERKKQVLSKQEIMDLMWFRPCIRKEFRTAFTIDGRLRKLHWDLLCTKHEDRTLTFPIILRNSLRGHNIALELREGFTDIDTLCGTLPKPKRSNPADELEDGSGHFGGRGTKRVRLWTETIPNGAQAFVSIKKDPADAASEGL